MLAIAGDTGAVKAAYRPAGAAGVFGTTQTVAASVTAFPSVSVNAGGAALAAWAPYPAPSAIAYADRPAGAGSSFGAPAAPTGGPTADGPFGLASVFPILDADGSATILYSTVSNGLYTFRQISRSSTGGAFGASSVVVADIAAPAVAINASGDAAIAWQSGGSIMAAYRPHDGGFGSAQTAAAPAALGFSFSSTQLGVDAAGRVLLVWGDLVNGCATTKPRISLAVRSTGGVWAAGQSVDGRNPELGLAPDGNRFVVLYRVASGAGGDPCVITADRAVADTGVDGVLAQAPQNLPGQTTSTEPTSSDNPKAATMDSAGNAYVLWTDGAAGPRKAAALESGTPPPGGGGGGDPGGTGGAGNGGPPGGPTPPAPPAPTLDPLGQFLASAPGFVRTGSPTNARLIIDCRQGTCSIIVDGQLLVYGSTRTGRASAAKPAKYRLARVSFTLAAGRSRTVVLKLPKAARTAAKRALARGGKVQAAFTVRNNGARRTATTTFKRR